jgi:hypothetical protein
MIESGDDLAKKVLDWLKSQGYPLEMEVALAFQQAGFTVAVSDFYEDFDSGGQREIDVSALRWSGFDNKVALQVCCRIECKLAKDKPWILFVSQAQPERFLPFQMISSEAYRLFLFDMYRHSEFRNSILSAALLRPRYVGHGLTQAFSSGQDVPYKAAMSSLKASVDRALQIDKFIGESTQRDKAKMACVVFPVIVIDGKLFECFVHESSQMQLIEASLGTLYWRGTGPKYTSSLVYVVTKPYLKDFVAQFDELATVLIDSALANIEGLSEAVNKVAGSARRAA